MTKRISSTSLSMYRRLLRYLRPYRLQFVAALACLIAFGATDGGVPFMVKHVLDHVFTNQNKDILKLIPIALVLFALFRGAADFGQQFLISRIGHRIVRDIRDDISASLLKQSPGYFVEHSAADLLSRTTSDVTMVRSMLTDSLSAIVRDSIRVLALLVASIYLDPTLALISFVVFPIGILPVVRFGKRMRKLAKRGQEEIGALSSRLQESILGARAVRLSVREDYEQERFERENDNLTRTFVKSEVARALVGPINEILAACAVGAVILYGGYSVIGGGRTQGDFIAFLVSVFLLYDPLKRLSRIHSTVQQSLASAERLFEVLDAVPTIVPATNPVPFPDRHDIAFENIHFSYGREAVLKGVSLQLRQGECIAVVGFSGSGKSTLVDLLPRFIDVDQGAVKIGGVDVRQLDLHDLRRHIAMVSQHTFLFNDTVLANIAYGLPQATEEQIKNAARAAYADDFIQKLPMGYQTIVGEGGFALSGGERQRIAIARAIIKNAPILVLDEATASLDNRAEREVQQALDTLAQNRTTIVIAHRLSTIARANRIIVMASGKIIEEGSEAQLLASGGEFKKLHALQFTTQSDGGASFEGKVA